MMCDYPFRGIERPEAKIPLIDRSVEITVGQRDSRLTGASQGQQIAEKRWEWGQMYGRDLRESVGIERERKAMGGYSRVPLEGDGGKGWVVGLREGIRIVVLYSCWISGLFAVARNSGSAACLCCTVFVCACQEDNSECHQKKASSGFLKISF